MAEKKEKGPLIYERMAAAQKEIDAVAKEQQNVQQKYKFRGIDDVYNAVHGVLAKHEIFKTTEVLEERDEERESRGGGALIYRILKVRFCFYTVDGSSVSSVMVGEGMDSGDKASNKALAAADKYNLTQVFTVPYKGMVDADKDSPEVKPKAEKDPPKQESPNKGKWRYADRLRFEYEGYAKNTFITKVDDEALQSYFQKIGTAMKDGKGYATQDHLDAISGELALRESSADSGGRNEFADKVPDDAKDDDGVLRDEEGREIF
jgi:hypothetical protein